MKLRKGLEIVIGRHTYRNEIPEVRFAHITASWSQLEVDEFIRKYGDEPVLSKKKKKKDE